MGMVLCARRPPVGALGWVESRFTPPAPPFLSVPWSAFVRRVVGQQVRRSFESKIFQDAKPVHFAAPLASKCSCSARQRYKSEANVLEPGRTVNAPTPPYLGRARRRQKWSPEKVNEAPAQPGVARLFARPLAAQGRSYFSADHFCGARGPAARFSDFAFFINGS